MELATTPEPLPTWFYWIIAFGLFALFMVVAITWTSWKTHPEVRALWLFFLPTLLFLWPLCPVVCALFSLLGMGDILAIIAGIITTFLLWWIWIIQINSPVMRYFDIRYDNRTFKDEEWRDYCRQGIEARKEKAKRQQK